MVEFELTDFATVAQMNHWIESLGGPLVLAHVVDMPNWGGTPDRYPKEGGDYGRACAVDEYIDVIALGAHGALILGGDPARTTLLPEQNIILQLAAGSEADIEGNLAAMLPTFPWDCELTWRVTGPLALWDSAASGLEARAVDTIELAINPGNYTFRAGYLERDNFWVTLIEFLPTST